MVLDVGCKMSITSSILCENVLWWAMVDGLHLELSIKCLQILDGTWSFCMIIEEDAKHKFHTCLVSKTIWIVMLQLWASLIEIIVILSLGFCSWSYRYTLLIVQI